MRVVVDQTDELGDGPTWDDAAQRLLWIDIVGKRLSCCAADGSDLTRTALQEIPGSFALRTRGGLLVAFRRRLAIFDVAGNELDSFIPAAADMSRERFNDGACDALGRFWVGTMDRQLRDPVGGLYRVDPDLSSRRVDSGLGIGNGIAWSPANDRLYHCDSRFPRIYVHDFDLLTGTVSNRRVFVEFSEGLGVPDGCAVDVAGTLWVAAPSTGCVLGFDPHGRLMRRIETPVRWPSAVAFGGTDRCTLFITSLIPKEALDSQPGALQPLDGALFATQCDVPGLPCHRFAG